MTVKLILCFVLFYWQLAAVNDKMVEYASAPGALSRSAALMHTLQRHRDILQVQTMYMVF